MISTTIINETELRNKISFFSFILSIFVVLIHSYNLDYFSNVSFLPMESFEKLLQSFFSVCVPSFFLLSGFLFYRNIQKNQLERKLNKRIFSLVIPYFVWNTIAFFYFLCLSKIPFLSSSINKSVDTALSTVFMDILIGKYNITWFLRNLIFFTFITAFIYAITTNEIVFILLFIISFFIPQVVHVSIKGWNIFNGYSYFVLGSIIGLYYPMISNIKFSKKFAAVCLFVSITLAYILMFCPVEGPFLYVLNIIKIVLLWISLDLFSYSKEPKWWMQLSFITYVSHSLIIQSVKKIIIFILGKNATGMVIDYFLSPIITFSIIVFLSKILMNQKQLWGLLNGQRTINKNESLKLT